MHFSNLASGRNIPFFISAGSGFVVTILAAFYAFISRNDSKIAKRIELGKSLEDAGYTAPDHFPTHQERQELGDYLSQLLLAHGYTHWNEHLDKVKLRLETAFPPLPKDKEERIAFLNELMQESAIVSSVSSLQRAF